MEPIAAELANLDAVRNMASEVKKRHGRLDILVNNAGVAGGQEGLWTVNVAAPFLLAHELRPVMTSRKNGRPARIVNVASEAQEKIDLDSLPTARGAEGPSSYGQSKLALIMLTLEMAERWKADEILANAVHPGTLLDTKMVREHYGTPLGSAESGAEVLEHLALCADFDGITGEYFRKKIPARANPQAYDREARAKLWNITAAMTGAG